MKRIFCYPKFSGLDLMLFRIGGPGLGNLLFPWARAVILSQKGYIFINPTWPQLKIGPLIRGEVDKRTYFSLFKKNLNGPTGFNRLWILLFGKRIEEDFLISSPLKDGDIVIIKGMKTMFQDLLGHSKFLLSKLEAILDMDQMDKLAKKNHCDFSIAVHIRFGDFSTHQSYDGESLAVNTRQALEWYINIILELQNKIGKNTRINIFSDATEIELQKIMEIPMTHRIKGNTAIQDIILISRHKMIIASNSSFSMWGAFLGQIPTIWPPNFSIQQLLEKNSIKLRCKFGQELICLEAPSDFSIYNLNKQL